MAKARAAYRRLALAVQPDNGASNEGFQALQAAYEQAPRLCRE